MLSKSTKPIPFVWQILELSEFFNYFLPQERLEKPHYNSLYIFISKSGSSRLLVKSIRQLKLLNMNKKLVWLVSNNRNPPIKDSIGYLFPTYVEEELVLGTKSFISTILVLYLISIALQGINPINENTHTALINLFTNLTDYRNNWYKITEEVMDFIGDNYSFFYFISREPASYATAAVSALSTMSFTRILSESISLGLFFHGPFQVLSDDYICFILIGDQLNKESKTLLERLTNQISKKLKSGRVILISNDITCCTNNEHIYTIQYECNINALSPIFEFNILQYIFLNIAKKRGVI